MQNNDSSRHARSIQAMWRFLHTGVVTTPTSPVALTWCNVCEAALNLPIPRGSLPSARQGWSHWRGQLQCLFPSEWVHGCPQVKSLRSFTLWVRTTHAIRWSQQNPVSVSRDRVRFAFSQIFLVDTNFLYSMSFLCLHLKMETNLPLHYPRVRKCLWAPSLLTLGGVYIHSTLEKVLFTESLNFWYLVLR